ncbi:FkbM family methyltransferase [Rhizobium sp. BK376]|jgi:FkbM family methyltransferase|uniref:FkbM family methyltransferase n=1 Tax=Rhizobium sp. BK376 TaxID=2512149 RepID=UPI001053E7A6|nr:FkbM family methyltransferase [Rhizobium sp. BK376]TCR82263.1 FkbM family methyltransferase [Rhizobium sp. BK376]
MANTFHPMSNHIALQKWQPFLETYSRRELRAKTDLLKALCDKDSASEIDCFIDRVLSHPPLSRRENFQIDYRTIAESTRSAWAKEQVKIAPKVDVPQMRDEYNLVDVDIEDKFIRPESFLYHCGLHFIPNAVGLLNGRAIIDGGAYRGESAAVLRKNYPGSRVHAFEPDATNFKILKQVSEKAQFLGGIVPVNQGLSSGSFAVTAKGDGHGTRLTRNDNAGGGLRVTSIDDYVESENISLGFIKLDIEGLEFDVIKGAAGTLTRDRPAFAVAIYHTPQDFLEIAPFVERLGLDYTLMVRHLHPQLTSFFGEFMLIGYPANR